MNGSSELQIALEAIPSLILDIKPAPKRRHLSAVGVDHRIASCGLDQGLSQPSHSPGMTVTSDKSAIKWDI